MACIPFTQTYLHEIQPCGICDFSQVLHISCTFAKISIRRVETRSAMSHLADNGHRLNYYERLHLSPDASAVQVRKNFRRFALECHPDRHTTAPAKASAAECFKLLIEAYETINDVNKRAAYDSTLCVGATHAATTDPSSHDQQTRCSDSNPPSYHTVSSSISLDPDVSFEELFFQLMRHLVPDMMPALARKQHVRFPVSLAEFFLGTHTLAEVDPHNKTCSDCTRTVSSSSATAGDTSQSTAEEAGKKMFPAQQQSVGIQNIMNHVQHLMADPQTALANAATLMSHTPLVSGLLQNVFPPSTQAKLRTASVGLSLLSQVGSHFWDVIEGEEEKQEDYSDDTDAIQSDVSTNATPASPSLNTDAKHAKVEHEICASCNGLGFKSELLSCVIVVHPGTQPGDEVIVRGMADHQYRVQQTPGDLVFVMCDLPEPQRVWMPACNRWVHWRRINESTTSTSAASKTLVSHADVEVLVTYSMQESKQSQGVHLRISHFDGGKDVILIVPPNVRQYTLCFPSRGMWKTRSRLERGQLIVSCRRDTNDM